jgi:Rifampin ADP-ribosyl transferase/NTPase
VVVIDGLGKMELASAPFRDAVSALFDRDGAVVATVHVFGHRFTVKAPPGCRGPRGEPTGPFEDDPNLTDKKFPGNPTRSYRTRQPLRVVGEVLDWEGHSPAVLQDMRDHLEKLKQLGVEAVNE